MRKGLGSLVMVLVLALLVTIALAGEKESDVYRVGVMVTGSQAIINPQIKGLLNGMEDAGYIEGKNVLVDLLREDADDKLRARVKAYIQQRIDVIVATSGAETAIARELTDKIPIVFMPAAEPVGSGFVKSLARPGTNLTGLTFYTNLEDIGKQLAVFKEVVSSMRQVIVLYDGRNDPTQAASLTAVRKTAAHLAIKLKEKPIKSIVEAEQALSALPKTAAGVFVICGTVFRSIKGIASIAIRKSMPLFGCSASQVIEQNVFLTYAPDLYYIGYRGASYVDRILRGAKPQYLPVETPTKFELVINLKTAKEIKLTVPSEVLILADRVIN
jgi:ABC-type uncharacterized transport system substrate-binding protein